MTIQNYSQMDIIDRWILADTLLDTTAEIETCDWCGKEFALRQKRAGKQSFCCKDHAKLFHIESRRLQRVEVEFRGDKYRIIYDPTPLDCYGNECRYPTDAIIPAVEFRFMLRNNLFTPGTQILNTHTGDIMTIKVPA